MPFIEQGVAAAQDIASSNPLDFYKKALAADPSCVSARVLIAVGDPSVARGNDQVTAALSPVQRLPAAERIALQYLAARYRFDVSGQTRIADELLRELPRNAIAHAFRVEALQLSGNKAASEAEYTKVLAIDPSFVGAYLALGYAALERDDLSGALRRFSKLVELRPKTAKAHDALGEDLLSAGRFTEASAAFEKAIAIDPEFAPAYAGDGVVKFYDNDQPGAVAALKEYVGHSQGPPAKAAAEIDLSYIELAHRDATAADKALDNSIALKAGDPYWPVLIAILRGSQREYAGSHTDAVAMLNRLSASIQAQPVLAHRLGHPHRYGAPRQSGPIAPYRS